MEDVYQLYHNNNEYDRLNKPIKKLMSLEWEENTKI